MFIIASIKFYYNAQNMKKFWRFSVKSVPFVTISFYNHKKREPYPTI